MYKVDISTYKALSDGHNKYRGRTSEECDNFEALVTMLRRELDSGNYVRVAIHVTRFDVATIWSDEITQR